SSRAKSTTSPRRRTAKSRSIRPVRARVAPWLCVLSACSSPQPPAIPDRETIGPPREASSECKPPTHMFAQDWFAIADLDIGSTCNAFIEQDECVIAIFRDCTDHDSTPPRSWQGAIGGPPQLDIELIRTRETSGSIMSRSPISCTGSLQDVTDQPVWA